jgi:hypothetical protein
MFPKRLLVLIAVGCIIVSARSQTRPHMDYKITYSSSSFISNVNKKTAAQAEQYIQQYDYLPEVPSTEAIEKNGFDLNDNRATWLTMTDELTLDLISIQETAGKTLLNTVDKK